MNTDVLIIGGGPAGLHAAYVVASKGAKTILVDESFCLGGQLNQQTQHLKDLPKAFDKRTGIALARTLTDRLSGLDITVLLQHTMIGMYQDGRVGVSNGEEIIPISAEKIIVTTGAAEEASIFPGWTLPGVMTIGAAQILMNREQVLPGRRALVIGSNDFTLEVCKQFIDNGMTVEAVVEGKDELEAENERTIHFLKEANVPIFLKSSVNVTGSGEAEKAFINHKGKTHEKNVDVVCIGKGFSPILEAFEILNCDFTYEKRLGGWVPQYAATMKTSTPSVYVAGNAAGISNIGGTLLTAEIAAESVAEDLEYTRSENAHKERERLWKEIFELESAEIFAGRIHVMRTCQHTDDELFTRLLQLSVGRVEHG